MIEAPPPRTVLEDQLSRLRAVAEEQASRLTLGRVVQLLAVGLLAAILIAVAAKIKHDKPVNIGRLDGPAVFVMEADGIVEAIDVTRKVSVGWLDLGGQATDMAYSPRSRRACFTIPDKKLLASLDLDDRRLEQGASPVPLRRLFTLPGQTMALGQGNDQILRTFELTRLTAGQDVKLPQTPRDVAVVSRVNAIAYLSSDGTGLALYAPRTRQFLGMEGLEPKGRALRLDARHNELWVLPESGGSELAVFDAATLEPLHVVTLPEPVRDVAFLEDPHVLLETSGDVAVVRRPGYTPDPTPLPGMRGARRILSPTPDELWFMGEGQTLEVHALDGVTPPRHVQLRGNPLDVVAVGGVQRR